MTKKFFEPGTGCLEMECCSYSVAKFTGGINTSADTIFILLPRKWDENLFFNKIVYNFGYFILKYILIIT